jgi:hypothetical protein
MRAGTVDALADVAAKIVRDKRAADAPEEVAELVDRAGGRRQLLQTAEESSTDPLIAIHCARLLVERHHDDEGFLLLSQLACQDAVEPRERIRVAGLLVDIEKPAQALAVVDLASADRSASPHDLDELPDLLIRLGRVEQLRQRAQDPSLTATERLAAARALGKLDKTRAAVIISRELATGRIDWADLSVGLEHLIDLAGYEALRPLATDRNISAIRRAEAASLLSDDMVEQDIAGEALDTVRRPTSANHERQRAIQALSALRRTSELVDVARDDSIELDARLTAIDRVRTHGSRTDLKGWTRSSPTRSVLPSSGCRRLAAMTRRPPTDCVKQWP